LKDVSIKRIYEKALFAQDSIPKADKTYEKLLGRLLPFI